MGFLLPSSIRCEKTAPRPYGEASKASDKGFLDCNVLARSFHLGFFSLSQMHFFLALAISILPPSLENYGVAQVYQQNVDNICGNISTTPETI